MTIFLSLGFVVVYFTRNSRASRAETPSDQINVLQSIVCETINTYYKILTLYEFIIFLHFCRRYLIKKNDSQNVTIQMDDCEHRLCAQTHTLPVTPFNCLVHCDIQYIKFLIQWKDLSNNIVKIKL